MGWTPPSPLEKSYYDALFTLADEERTGSIGGRNAVLFFSKSGLDKTILREIWTIADARQASQLGVEDFYIAMRLIAMAQQGQPVTIQRFQELAQSPFTVAILQGVPPPAMPAPPMSGQSFAISEEEKCKYNLIFQQYDTDLDGFIQGPEAVNLFQMSGLDREHLRTVWALADRSSDGQLDLTEFYIAMHIIVCVTKRGMQMPTSIPYEMEQSLQASASFTAPPPVQATNSFTQQRSSSFGPPPQAFGSNPPNPETAATGMGSGFDAFEGLAAPLAAPPAAAQPQAQVPQSTSNYSSLGSVNVPQPNTGFGSFSNQMGQPQAPQSNENPAHYSGRGFGSFAMSPPASSTPSPSTAAFGSRLGSNMLPPVSPAPSSIASSSAAAPTSGFGSFGASPAPSGQFGSNSGSAVVGFGAFDVVPSVPMPTSSNFGSNPGAAAPTSFGAFDALPVASTAPTSNFGSNSGPPMNASSSFGGFGMGHDDKPQGFDAFPPPSGDLGQFKNEPPQSFGSNSSQRQSSFMQHSPAINQNASFTPQSSLNCEGKSREASFSHDSRVSRQPSITQSMEPSNSGLASSGGFGDFGGFSTQPSPPVPSATPGLSNSFGGLSLTKESTQGGFGDFPSPLPATTSQDAFTDFSFPTPVKTSRDAFGAFPSPVKNEPLAAPIPIAPAAAAPAITPTAEASSRELDAANVQVLTTIQQFAQQQILVAKVVRVQSLITNLLQLTLQKVQAKKPVAGATDPSLVASLQKLIEDERAFISATTATISQIESKKASQPKSDPFAFASP
ncbi:hypothetical protein THRCLA_01439 [Thraustotheca clavata]|uniref:Uncharacterized protein n=1 Tax=Thraustotheca clavata TaxID=74557 RepID=A0A1W0A8M5_9STRA|nr:hypothetical protein THRCLA_01439 [Thraustotheca clavata]